MRAPPIAVLLLVAACTGREPNTDWRVTGGDPGNSRFSSLDQINTTNVAQLKVAWIFHTGDLAQGAPGEIQASPIVIDGVLYTTTPALAVIALRAENGTLIWRFDPRTTHDARRTDFSHVNRGVVYWGDSSDRRIFFTAGRRLYALDARTGRPIPAFGDSGSIDLAAGLSRAIGEAYLVATSPGAIYRDLLIQGMRVGEEEGSAPGDLRAYDVHTGAIRWTFHTIPHPGELGYETWPAGARVDAVAQIAKSGFVFLFDRQSGRPLFDIKERPVPASDLRGEHAWPTQPFPVKPAPFARQTIVAADVTEQQQRFRALRSAFFAPPSRAGSIVLPGFDGGGEWGGAAVDPATATLYVNASDVPWIAAMREPGHLPPSAGAPRPGPAVDAAACAACHAAGRPGRGP